MCLSSCDARPAVLSWYAGGGCKLRTVPPVAGAGAEAAAGLCPVAARCCTRSPLIGETLAFPSSLPPFRPPALKGFDGERAVVLRERGERVEDELAAVKLMNAPRDEVRRSRVGLDARAVAFLVLTSGDAPAFGRRGLDERAVFVFTREAASICIVAALCKDSWRDWRRSFAGSRETDACSCGAAWGGSSKCADPPPSAVSRWRRGLEERTSSRCTWGGVWVGLAWGGLRPGGEIGGCG